MQSIDLTHPDTHLILLTGAGTSAESGIPTYRAMNGLWRTHSIQEVATAYGFLNDPALGWRFYSERRVDALAARPNAGHLAIAAIEERLGDRFLLVTQNIDGLHQRAGSRRVIELHGNLLHSRCTACERPAFQDERLYTELPLPLCDLCADKDSPGMIRPAVVWFGEAIQGADMARVERFMERAPRGHLVFMAAGTSGVVTPASAFVEDAKRLGAETWLVNLDRPENVGYFQNVVLGASGAILPKLFYVEQVLSPNDVVVHPDRRLRRR